MENKYFIGWTTDNNIRVDDDKTHQPIVSVTFHGQYSASLNRAEKLMILTEIAQMLG